jgi:hypothetical protein
MTLLCADGVEVFANKHKRKNVCREFTYRRGNEINDNPANINLVELNLG